MTTPSSYVPGAGEEAVVTYPGIYPGTVVNNNDPLGVGRLQLYVPMVLANAVSAWAVPLGTYYSLPANHTPVAVAFLGGDPAQPAWIGPLDLSPIVNAAVTAVTYSSTEPPDPKVGDIWYQVFTLDGTVFYGPAQIWTFNSGTSTFSWVASAQSGAGANPLGMEVPNVSGGTITGAQFIGTGESQEFVLFGGTPRDSNMIASTVSAAAEQTNTGGGTTLPGIVYYGQTGGPDSVPLALQLIQFIGDNGIGPNGGAIIPYTTTATSPSSTQANWTAPDDTVFGQGITLGSIIFALQGSGPYNLYLSGAVAVSGGLFVVGGGITSTAGTATSPTLITTDTWHPITLDSGWSTIPATYAVPSYRLLPDGNLQLTGLADFGSVTSANHNLNSGAPIPAAWCPQTEKVFRSMDGNTQRGGVQISPSGVIEFLASASFPARYCEIDAVLPLGI